jgi:hypothetical protein
VSGLCQGSSEEESYDGLHHSLESACSELKPSREMFLSPLCRTASVYSLTILPTCFTAEIVKGVKAWLLKLIVSQGNLTIANST